MDPPLHCTSAAWVSRREAAQASLTLPKCNEMMALAQGERQEQAWSISFLNPPWQCTSLKLGGFGYHR